MRAGLELFTAQGYRGTTTLDIASRARIAEATIYRHFVGKEALFNEGYRQALRWLVGVVKTATGVGPVRPAVPGQGEGVKAKLAQVGRTVVEQVPKDPARVLMALRRPDGPGLEEATTLLQRELRDGLVQLIAAGKQQGAIRPGAADLWAAIWQALLLFAVERVAARDWSPDHPSVAATFDAAWDAIAYRAPA